MNDSDRARIEGEAKCLSNEGLLENYLYCEQQINGWGGKSEIGYQFWTAKKEIVKNEILSRMKESGKQ